LDSEGYVRVPQEPGMGYKIDWDYIEENLTPSRGHGELVADQPRRLGSEG